LGRTILLVRLSSEDFSDDDARPAADNHMGSVAEKLPEGVVIVDQQGNIVQANPAFLDLVRVISTDRIEGKPLDTWLGGSRVDLQVLMANLREHGTMRRFSSVVRDALGTSQPVEVSAATITARDGPLYGFSIREIPEGRRAGIGHPVGTTTHLTELVGRVPLKSLVRDTADIIEKLCIEAALRLTENNRASAADMLGLSRQSLYLKLKRFGISDGEPTDGA
ncbi:MAG: PAS domain-containing protein, partial [Hyphomicrobiales bacterium]